MKKLLSILLLCFCFSATAQTPCLFNYCDESEMPVTDNNMSVAFPAGTLDDYVGGMLQAYIAGSPVSDTFHIGAEADNYVYSDGVTVIGTDYQCGCDLADWGETIQFAIFMNGNVILIDVNPPITYAANGFEMVSGSLSFTINGANVVHGCMDNNYLEFNPSVNIDNGSCEVIIIDGCTDSEACNYISEANFDDGSCLYLDYDQSLFNACCLGNSITTICLLDEYICSGEDFYCITYGCTELWADNYDPFITQDDGSCYKMGCTSEWADNYDAIANTDDGSCDRLGCTSDWADNFDEYATIDDESCYRYGCTSDWADNYDNVSTENDGSCYKMGCTEDWADNYDELATAYNDSCSLESCTSPWADNYDSNATIDDGSCIYSSDYVDAIQIQINNLESEATSSLSSLQQALDTWNTTIDLSAGWNMFGYGCPTSIDLVQGLSNHTELIAMVKDNNGSAYIPEFDFNGIGDLTPGFGYQIKVIGAIEDFSLCDWYVNDIPEDNIVSLQEENASLQAELDSIYGCVDETACNYDVTASLDDGSCYNNDLGCGCDTPGSIEGLDCDGNEITQYQVGDLAEGGIVFYVDETGQHGLVAASEDLTDGASDPNGWGVGYEWGCYQNNIIGAQERTIGFGYQNTLDVVNQNCSTVFGGITAAEASLDYEADGYSDWYLPSIDELFSLYINLEALDISQDNIFGFENAWYWSSTQNNHWSAECVNFNTGSLVVVPGSTYSDYNGNTPLHYSGGHVHHHGKDTSRKVRVIRAF